MGNSSDWEARVAAVWADADALGEEELVRHIEALVAERPEDDAAARFELASVYDSVGREHEAEGEYRRALAGDLDAVRRARTAIQFGSTLRNTGKLEESIAILRDAAEAGPNVVTGDAATTFLALSLIDAGRDREAALCLLRALIPHLPRYHRSMSAYVLALETEGGPTT